MGTDLMLDPNVNSITKMDITKKDLVEIIEVDLLKKLHLQMEQIESRINEIYKIYGSAYWPAMEVLDNKEKERVTKEYLLKFKALKIGKFRSSRVHSVWSFKVNEFCCEESISFNNKHLVFMKFRPIGIKIYISLQTGYLSAELHVPVNIL